MLYTYHQTSNWGFALFCRPFFMSSPDVCKRPIFFLRDQHSALARTNLVNNRILVSLRSMHGTRTIDLQQLANYFIDRLSPETFISASL